MAHDLIGRVRAALGGRYNVITAIGMAEDIEIMVAAIVIGIAISVSGSAALLALAWMSHALPVAWAAGALAYAWVSFRLAPRHRVWLMLSGVALVLAFSGAVVMWRPAEWVPAQIQQFSGADQVWVYGPAYAGIAVALLFAWVVLFLRIIEADRWRILFGLPFQLAALSAAVVCFFPRALMVPGYRGALSFIAERMSLVTAVCVCAVLARARPSAGQKAMLAAVAVMFFAFVHRDEAALNRIEDNLQAVVKQ